MRDYIRGAKMSRRAEIRRREEQAPLLHAAGVLPEIPTVEVIAARREEVDRTIGSSVDRVNAERCRSAQLYRETIEELHGAATLSAIDDEFRASHSARLGAEYVADWYCQRLSVLTGWTRLETFQRNQKRLHCSQECCR